MNKETTIFGLGAIGSNVAYNLLQSEPRLVLNGVDKDVVELRNLGNQIYSQPFVGQSKADAFVAEVYMRTQNMPKGKFTQYNVTNLSFGSSAPIVKKSDLLVDAFDNFHGRDVLHRIAQVKPSIIVHLGFGIVDKSLFGTIQWNDVYQAGQTDAQDQDVCQIPDATWWIKGATAIMTMNVLNFLRKDEMKSLIIKPDLVTKNL